MPPKTISPEQAKRRNATLDRYLKEEALLDSLNRAYGELLRNKTESDTTQTTEVKSSADEAIVYSVKVETAVGTPEDDISILESSTLGLARHGKSFDGHGIDEMPLLREFTESTCPGINRTINCTIFII